MNEPTVISPHTLQWAHRDYFEVGLMCLDPESPTGLLWVPMIQTNHQHPVWPDPEHMLVSQDGLHFMMVPLSLEEWSIATTLPKSGRGLIHRAFN